MMVRCAIYTRKSTDEGLDQSFNSLDAQREACEAYIRSQAGEGWRALATTYDDGGYSGGNLERPAMQQLLAEVDAGKVDVIVVYKVDRLTRSLLDFAKIVERLDARGVSFVSVTQAFNTTTSMGRLTLNVLLSFAQFEREVTGERIRDKIAASKAKGMWMGGNVPLGYDLQDRRLVVNSAEADQVRHIFTRYQELRSGVALMKELRRDGIASKRWLSRSGKERGGAPLSCGALYYLLQNRLYLGEIVHRGASHAGAHDPVIDERLFDAVQEALAANRRKHEEKPIRSGSCPLAGLVRDGSGARLTTSFSYGRGGRLYRYYVTGSLDPSRPESSAPPTRIAAGPLERLVLDTLGRLLHRPVSWTEALPLIAAVQLHERSIQLAIHSCGFAEPHEPIGRVVERLRALVAPDRLVDSGDQLRLIVDRQPVFRGGRVSIPRHDADAAGEAASCLRTAHRLLAEHSMSPLEWDAHPNAQAPSWQRRRHLMALGLLSPRLQKAILQGSYAGSIETLLSKPQSLAWADQL
jgi:DNA invertase Pin-like site-specific DNA recombinase